MAFARLCLDGRALETGPVTGECPCQQKVGTLGITKGFRCGARGADAESPAVGPRLENWHVSATGVSLGCWIP